MGLFTNEGEQKTANAGMKPLVVRTSNVAKELLQAASNHKIPVQSLDFRLLDTQTFAKKSEDAQGEWLELSSDEIRDLNEELLLSPRFELKQVYEIEIFTPVESTPFDGIDMAIGGNPTLCNIYLTIKAGSTADYYETFEPDLLRTIHKKMLRANLIIGVFDSMMAHNLSEFFAKVKVREHYTFEKPERYLISQGYEPVPTVDDKLILHYETKRQNEDEQGRIDYAKRGYVISAVENELLVEYIKPKLGESGRNCRGEFLSPKEPLVRNEPTFTTGENILVVDTPQSIEYRAKIGGYVTYEGGVYDIKTEVDITEISFKTTGSIDTQLDADVSINVKEKDFLKDAVGTGMDVTVNVINVDGNVGANAKITAHKATVEGQVHQSALIKADELRINVHKGTAYGKKVHITRLEHGVVEADEVTIVQATGGKIRAREITIETLGSNVKMTASHKIEVKKLMGGENRFVIDPLIEEDTDILAERSEKMEQMRLSIRDVQRELSEYEQTWYDNAPSMEDLKRKLIHYKTNNITAPAAFVQKYQQFQHLKEKIEAIRNELKAKEDHFNYLAQKHTALQSEIFNARIINHDMWKNHNEIVFKMIEPPVDIEYIPRQNGDEKILGLVQDPDGEFIIKVMAQ